MLISGPQVGIAELQPHVDFVPLEDIHDLTLPMEGLTVGCYVDDHRQPGSERRYSQIHLVPADQVAGFYAALDEENPVGPHEFGFLFTNPGNLLFSWLQRVDQGSKEVGSSLRQESLVLSWRITSLRLALSAGSRLIRP